MKTYLTTLLVTMSILSYGQIDSVDIWISKIHNSQVKLNLGYIGYIIKLGSGSEAAHKIFKVGAPATDKLFDLLISDDRGVISHYLLTLIHYPNCILKYEGLGRFIYNGLELESNGNFGLTTKIENLITCKETWSKVLGK